MIIRNAAQCSNCQDVIQSTHVHDYVSCKCGAIAVDGGNEYLKSLGNNIITLYVSSSKKFVPESANLENSDVVLAAHHSSTCEGKQCPLHKRTDHEMRGWRQSVYMAGSTFVMARICPHDVIHTDPDDFYVYDIDWCDICKPHHKKLVFA